MTTNVPTPPDIPATRSRPGRRGVLLALGTAGGATGIGVLSDTPARADGDTDQDDTVEASPGDFAAVRDTWRTMLLGDVDGIDDARIAAAAARVDEAATDALEDFSTTAPLWPDLPFQDTADNISLSLQRMVDVATAWASPASDLHDDADTAKDLVSALGVLSDKAYYAGRTPQGNWWHWEIGVPNSLTDLLVLLGDEVPDDLRKDLVEAMAYFAPDPNHRGRGTDEAETGANRSDKALRCALRGAIGESAEDMTTARDALSDTAGGGKNSLFGYVTSGDGFYEDGSVIQHSRLPYVGTYGTVALGGLAKIIALLSGSPWEVDDPAHTMLFDVVEDSFAPFIVDGVMSDTVRGRAVSRKDDTGAGNALSSATSTLLLAEAATGDVKDHLVGRALSWAGASSLDLGQECGVPDLARLVAAEQSGTSPIDDRTGLQFFADQERMVHRRGHWAMTISTSSERIGRYEWGNKENARGWYQGDGVTYLMLADDPRQTDTDYWPTVDPYRLPGTTVEMSEREDGLDDGTGIPEATASWAGGVGVQDTVGTWGVEHTNHDATLHATKSWFLLEDMVVALGAHVGSSTSAPVETTVENRALHKGRGPGPKARLTVDGHRIVPSPGDEHTIDNPGWAHLEGVGGYVFLDAPEVRFARVHRTGTWSDINGGTDTVGDDSERAIDYATVSLLHGKKPKNASYAYVLAPTLSVPGTDALAHALRHDRRMKVLENTRTVQAIRVHQHGGIALLANVFAPARTKDLTCDGPAALALADRHGELELSVADPSRTRDTVTLTLEGVSAHGVQAHDDSVEVLDLDPVRVRVTTRGSRGHGHQVTLRK
jgi:hyaluronate lyase